MGHKDVRECVLYGGCKVTYRKGVQQQNVMSASSSNGPEVVEPFCKTSVPPQKQDWQSPAAGAQQAPPNALKWSPSSLKAIGPTSLDSPKQSLGGPALVGNLLALLSIFYYYYFFKTKSSKY